jgi:hypothetical protein
MYMDQDSRKDMTIYFAVLSPFEELIGAYSCGVKMAVLLRSASGSPVFRAEHIDISQHGMTNINCKGRSLTHMEQSPFDKLVVA